MTTAADVRPTTERAERFRLLRPLQSRDFRLLWAGQGVSLLGDQFQAVALAWLVLSLTGSGLALGAVFVYQLTLFHRFGRGQNLRVGLKAFLKAA